VEPKFAEGGAGQSEQATAQGSRLQIITTAPQRLLRHNISDEELEMLGNLRRDGLSEVFWGMFGAAAASIFPAAEAIWRAYFESPAVPLDPLHLFEVVVFFVVALLAGAFGIISSHRGSNTIRLVKEIRSRSAS
jgi:hypothetical protein